MSLELKQNLRLSQQLVMTPQLQQAIKLLQLSRLELQDLIRDEMMQNPLLEEPVEGEAGEGAESEVPADSSKHALETEALPDVAQKPSERMEEVKGEGQNEIDWDNYLNNYQLTHNAPSGSRGSSEDLPSYEATLTKKTSLFDHLLWQLKLSAFTPDEERVAMLILGNLNDDGYLKFEGEVGDAVIQVASAAGASHEVAGRVLHKVQMLDPVGVAARDLQECLLLQARHLGVEHGLVGTIIKKFLKQVESKNYPAIARELKLPLEEVVEAIKVISQMEPKPGRAYAGDDPQYITPDIYVHKVGDDYITVLNDDGLSKLRVSGLYRAQLQNGAPAQAKEYIQDKLRSAVWLIRSIHQRQRTIFKVTESIVKFQREFLDKGVAHLQPLILRDVANDIAMHESTVSRVTSNKYVHTPQGIFELKYFFNSSISRVGGGKDLASEAVKSHLKQIVAGEDPSDPCSDQRIVELMRGRGVDIARRTVAKYREELGILPSSKRRKYF
ncbi:MAG: RNA polymerase factor sigma-54 [Deltaproteobacteria bacterium]